MARASTFTLLPLPQYARVMGISGMHFNQGISSVLQPGSCSKVWFQHDWQAGKNVSREGVAIAITNAELDLADACKYWAAPTYIESEFHRYPRPARPEVYARGANVRGGYKSIRLGRGWVVEGGRRATEILGTTCWTGIDADGDGFIEIARFELAGVNTALDVCQVKAYFKEYEDSDAENSRTDVSSSGADYAWEVRPFKTELDGSTLRCYFWTWDLFRPQLQEELGPSEIDADDFGDGPPDDPCDYQPITDLGSYVDELVFYREYTDPENQVEFLWGSNLSCASTAVCTDATQAGCFSIKDERNSLVTPRPGIYNSGVFTSTTWNQAACVEPDAVKIWYKAGWVGENQRGCVSVDDWWAYTIAMLATSRLQWDLCDCSNAKELSSFWRQDAAKMTQEKSFNLHTSEMPNPFGQRVGEVLAWRRIRNRSKRIGRAINV